MKPIIAIVLAASLAGCAGGIAGNDANIYNSLNGQRIVATKTQ